MVLFGTCFTNFNRPELGKAVLRVLRHNDCKVACPSLSCCGMPALDAADLDLARSKARNNVKTLLPWVEKGYLDFACPMQYTPDSPVFADMWMISSRGMPRTVSIFSDISKSTAHLPA